MSRLEHFDDPYAEPESVRLPSYMVRDPHEAPFQVDIEPDSEYISVHVNARAFSGRFLATRGTDEDKLEQLLDDVTRKAKWAIIDYYGLLGELDLRSRQQNAKSLIRLQRMLHGGANLTEVGDFVDFMVEHNDNLDYPWRA